MDAPPRVHEPHHLRQITADLVILGGGASGLIAAVRAAELSGKKVIVLERAKKPGGNAWYAHDFSKYGTKWEMDAGQPDIRDEVVRRYIKHLEWKINPHLIYKAVYGTGKVFDWMYEKDPEEVTDCFEMRRARELWFTPPGEKPRLAPSWKGRRFENLGCRDAAIGPGMGGYYVIRKMLQECNKLGIEILPEHRAVKILTDAAGNFSSVIADDPGGQTRVDAKACVLATGGWGRNDEMIDRLYPWFCGREEGSEPPHRFAIPTTTGDVVGLGESCGAIVDRDNMFLNLFGPIHHPFSFSFFIFSMQPEIVYINMNGNRFFDESEFANGPWVIHNQPKRYFYAVTDAEIMDSVMKRLASEPQLAPDKWLFDTYELDLKNELEHGLAVKKADTIEELAENCKIPPKIFLGTIERYNEFCARGFDADFYKKPEAMKPIKKAPFYAIFNKTATDGAFGGVLINEDSEVLRKDGKPIKGLYACGDNTGSWGFRRPGPGDHRMFLLSELTWAVSSGFLAGNSAGKYI